MKKLLLSLMLPCAAYGQSVSDNPFFDIDNAENEDVIEEVVSAPSILQLYADSLQRLVDEFHSPASQPEVEEAPVSPYFFQMVSQGTLYSNVLKQSLTEIDWMPDADSTGDQLLPESDKADGELVRLSESYAALGQIYVNSPALITVTEEQIKDAGQVRKDVDTPINSDKKISAVSVELSELETEDEGEVVAIVRRPNFWDFNGSNSLNLTQNYASDNWFQGKANHYNALAMVTINAKYDNKRKIQWENRLELQLGFQTNNDNDNINAKLRPTNNLGRFNSKLGIKAAKNWYYTFNVKAETQLIQNFDYGKKPKQLITRFLDPLNVDISVGIDWKWNLKRFSGSLFLAPVTYNLKYVETVDLAQRYGIDKDCHSKNTFGPSATLRYKWQIASNISWDSRLYWMSNLHYTKIEYENTISFSINKYLTSKFYFYPRFDDSSRNFRKRDKDGQIVADGTHWMFKEWLSLGISYDW